MPMFDFSEKYAEGDGQILPYYVGPLSKWSEFHAYEVGMRYSLDPRYEGIPEDVYNPDSDIYHKDVDKEGHYASTGYIHGEYSKYGMTAVALYLGSNGCKEAFNLLI